MRNGRRRPAGLVERSLIRPATGLRMTSHALGRKTTSPATAGRHAEPVGEVGQEQQAGHRAERAGRHRAEPVAAPGRGGETRRWGRWSPPVSKVGWAPLPCPDPSGDDGAVGTRQRFRGRIAGVGSTSGVRVVVGWWHESPFGPFADAMVERADGHRILLAPTEQVRDLVATTYVFDETPGRAVLGVRRWGRRLAVGRRVAVARAAPRRRRPDAGGSPAAAGAAGRRPEPGVRDPGRPGGPGGDARGAHPRGWPAPGGASSTGPPTCVR